MLLLLLLILLHTRYAAAYSSAHAAAYSSAHAAAYAYAHAAAYASAHAAAYASAHAAAYSSAHAAPNAVSASAPFAQTRYALRPEDRIAMTSAPGIAAAIRTAVLEGLRYGSRGVVHEMLLARQQHWCFRLQDIAVPAAFLWHGEQDPVVPLAVAKQYEAIPGCTATYFPGETHTTIIINRFAAALEALAVAAHGRQLQPSAAAHVEPSLGCQQLQPFTAASTAVAAHVEPSLGCQQLPIMLPTAAAAVAEHGRQLLQLQLQPRAAAAAAAGGSFGC
jgi:hypothetical protein